MTTRTWETLGAWALRPYLRVEAGLINASVAAFEIVETYDEVVNGVSTRKERAKVAGTVKWDGCVDLDFRPNDWPTLTHVCGVEGFDALVDDVRRAIDRAFGLIAEDRRL